MEGVQLNRRSDSVLKGVLLNYARRESTDDNATFVFVAFVLVLVGAQLPDSLRGFLREQRRCDNGRVLLLGSLKAISGRPGRALVRLVRGKNNALDLGRAVHALPRAVLDAVNSLDLEVEQKSIYKMSMTVVVLHCSL